MRLIGVLLVTLTIASARLLRGIVPTWSTSDRSIVRYGNPVELKGINFHGTETSCRVQHGLWMNPLWYYLDVLRMNNFNAVRIPLSYEVMHDLTLRVNDDCLSADPSFKGWTVGDYLDRLLDMCWDRRISVLFDLHTINSEITPFPWTDQIQEVDVIGAWANVLQRYGRHPALLGVEIKNEAHGDCTIDVLLQHHRRLISAIEGLNIFSGLYFLGGVQGEGDNPWGGTFEGSSILSSGPLFDDPRLQERLVLAPHVYGPDVRGDACKAEGPEDMERRFGFVWDTKDWNATPIITTEYGGFMRPGSADLDYFEKYLQYSKTKGMTNGSFFWTFPETSLDTGGLLVGPDWRRLDQTKIDFLYRMHPTPTHF